LWDIDDDPSTLRRPFRCLEKQDAFPATCRTNKCKRSFRAGLVLSTLEEVDGGHCDISHYAGRLGEQFEFVLNLPRAPKHCQRVCLSGGKESCSSNSIGTL